MKVKIINIILLLSLVNLFKCLPSDDIWYKLKTYIEENKIVLNDNRGHFIYDESNYTGLPLNSTKMEILYQKQKELFFKYNLANYIFVVDYLDENLESIEDAANNLSRYLNNIFKIDMEQSIIALFSMRTKRVRIRTGKITRENILDYEASSIINNLVPYMRSEQYYDAWIKLIENIDEYYNN